MKKIVTLLILFLFSNSCGYTPVYKNNKNKNIKFNFEIIEKSGDVEINNYIISNLDRYQDKNLSKKIQIKVDSNFIKSGISNNKKGETNAYTITIKTEFDVYKEVKNKKFTLNEKININRSNDTFEQKNYELKIKKDISRTIVDRFINKLLASE